MESLQARHRSSHTYSTAEHPCTNRANHAHPLNTEIPEELIGIADTRSKFNEHVSILRKDTME